MADNTKGSKSYLEGAAILAAAAAIVKLIGALYKIPLGNILGEEGTSTFNVSYTIYAFLIGVSTAGLPVALSKMIATANALGRPRQVKQVYRMGRNAFVCMGVVSFLIMALFSRQLASLLNKPDAALSILILSPAALFVCLFSAYRGYAQGFSDMVPTSVSQIIEAVGKLAIGLPIAWLLTRWGYGSAYTSAGAIAGVTIGTVVACLYLAAARRRIEKRMPTRGSLDTPDSNRRILRQLLNIAIPLTLGASVLNIINIVDNTQILGRLQSVLGYTAEQAAFLHGTYSYTMTLSNLPSAFILTITVSLIPAISDLLAKGNSRQAKVTAESGIRITCLLALPAGVGLAVLADPIMHALYGSTGYGGVMAIMGIASFFLCFFQVTNCVLQAYGFQRYTVYTLPLGGIIKIAVNWVLLSNANINIYGAAIGTLACYGSISLINVVLVKRSIPKAPSFASTLFKPLLCTGAMGLTAWAGYGLLKSGIFSLLSGYVASYERYLVAVAMAGAIGLAVIVYLILVIALKALTLDDVLMLPKGEKLAKLLRIS